MRAAKLFAWIGLVILFAVMLSGCIHVTTQRKFLSLSELRDMEQCVIAADDQVERQNCVERYIPSDSK